MRTLPFTKYSPCGNTTILFRNVPLSPLERARVATEAIAAGHLEAEQAGFADTLSPLPRMDMMGGEFCVNATRAFAVELLSEGRLVPEGNGWFSGTVQVSGMPEAIPVRVRSCGGARYEAAALLDLPQAPAVERLETGLSRVRVPGITHLVLNADTHPLPADTHKGTEELFRRYEVWDEDAAGCIWLHRTDTGFAITPYVRVKATNTTYAETACGSGTLAASIICRAFCNGGDGPLSLRQPGGESLTVRQATPSHPNGWAAWVEGPVRLIARGDVFVESLDTGHC